MGRIAPEKQYLPQEMSKAGYLTAMIGKWHLKEEPASFDYYKRVSSKGAAIIIPAAVIFIASFEIDETEEAQCNCM